MTDPREQKLLENIAKLKKRAKDQPWLMVDVRELQNRLRLVKLELSRKEEASK